MTAFDVYLLSIAGSLSDFFEVVAGISVAFFVVFFVAFFVVGLMTTPMWLDFFDVELNKFPFKKILLWFVPSWVLCALLATAIPDKKLWLPCTAYLMLPR